MILKERTGYQARKRYNKLAEKVSKNEYATDQEKLNYSDQVMYRMEYEEFIINLKPTLFVTLTFTDPARKLLELKGKKPEKPFKIIPDAKSVSTANELIKRMNKNLFGRNKDRYFYGVGCIEYQKCGQPHFHLAINSTIKAQPFLDLIEDVVNNQDKRKREQNETRQDLSHSTDRLVKAVEKRSVEEFSDEGKKLITDLKIEYSRSKVPDHFACLNMKDIDVQDVYHHDVANYITKVLESGNEGRIVLLDKDGIDDIGKGNIDGWKVQRHFFK